MAKNLILEQNSISQRISSSYNNFLQDGNESIYNASTRLESLFQNLMAVLRNGKIFVTCLNH